MQICIKTLTGKTVTLEVWNSDTIEKVKERAMNKLGIQSVNHRLTRAGKGLEAENSTIREVEIRKCETLTICGRLHGGVAREILGNEKEQEAEIREILGIEREPEIRNTEKNKDVFISGVFGAEKETVKEQGGEQG